MIRLFSAVALCAVVQLSAGCKHTGGECDCAPVPGDSVGVNPHLPGYGAQTGSVSVVAPLGTVVPVPAEPSALPKTIPPAR